MRASKFGRCAVSVAILASAPAFAVGTGSIVQGVGQIGEHDSITTVTQSSDKLIVNWDNMDVARGETLNFVQPSETAAVLNRIDAVSPTMLDGTLTSNGRVFITNPAGITIGNGASINVGSLVASSLNIADEHFMNVDLDTNFEGSLNDRTKECVKGCLKFERTDAAGAIVNNGRINAKRSVVLAGPHVQNNHEIKTLDGDVVMVASNGFKLALDGERYRGISFPAPGAERKQEGASHQHQKTAMSSGIENGKRGRISAEHGNLVLFDTMATALQGITNSGNLEAGGIGDLGGIRLTSFGDIKNTGAMKGQTVDMTSADSIVNAGSLHASREIVLTSSGNDITNRGNVEGGSISFQSAKSIANHGVLRAHGDIKLNADEGITNDEKGAILARGHVVVDTKDFINRNTVSADGEISLLAGRDAVNHDRMTAGGDVTVTAGRNFTSHRSIESRFGNISIVGDGTFTNNGTINAKGDIELIAERDMIFGNDHGGDIIGGGTLSLVSAGGISTAASRGLTTWFTPKFKAGKVRVSARSDVELGIIQSEVPAEITSRQGDVHVRELRAPADSLISVSSGKTKSIGR